MPPMPIPPHRASLPSGPNSRFGVSALLRRFSTPSPYGGNILAGQPAAQPAIDPTGLIHDQVHDASLYPAFPANTVHQYNLKSRGRDYALITVRSHALNVEDPPLLYFGETLRGLVILSLSDLGDMQSMEVVLQVFDSDPITPIFEVKRVLLSQRIDDSHISGGNYCWPFTIVPPTDPDSSTSSLAESSHGHQSSNSHSTGSNLRFQLIVTIHRRGRLTQNVGVKQEIVYVLPPDPSLRSSPAPISATLSVDTATIASWPQQKFPAVHMRGVLFGQANVEVECKLITPLDYPACYTIPLRLFLTSESHEALDVFAVSHVIDVRLQKVVAFGDRAGAVRPLSLKDRDSYQRVELAAKANWELDDHTKELPPDERHRSPRWRIKLNGSLQINRSIELSPSYEEPGVSMAVMYFVSLFPFRSADFRPAHKPNKELAIGKIKLTKPC